MIKGSVVESHEFPGFYEIPGYSNYVISREGRVVNKRTHAELNGSKLSTGYHVFRLRDDEGKTLTWGRHRLLGFVFNTPSCSIEGMVINHKNGIKGDDNLNNLEWVTYQGNAEHAGSMGLTEKCIPISVRDVRTGEVKNYASIKDYAREVGWSKDKVGWRVKIGETRVFPEGKQYRRADINTPWFIPKNIEMAVLLNSKSRKTLIKHLLTGEIKEFPSLTEAARYLRVSKASVSGWLKFPNQPVLPGFIQIKFAHDDTPWREVVDPYLEYELYLGDRVVKVINSITGESFIFGSAKECGHAFGLTPQTLNNRLKSKGTVVYPDGFSYAYYSDTV